MSRHRRDSGNHIARAIAVALGLLVLASGLVVGFRPHTRPAAAQSEIVMIHSAHGDSFLSALRGKKPLFILALGSDARPGQSIARQRADSIHIIGIDKTRTRASILGFPRDSWVKISGGGTNKINSAMVVGGPEGMVRTLENLTGIRIDFWILTSFGGLRNMVDWVGGIDVVVPYAMHDSYSGANFKAGKIHMRGYQALAFARNRHDTPNGDFSRSGNQGRLFLAALSELRRDFTDDPTKLFTWISAGWRNIQTDLSAEVLLDLAITANQVSSNNVNNIVVPGSTGTVGGASVVFISSSASSVYADMRKDGLVR
jgi:LCP family protein required for cell wall assembly